MRTAFLLEFFDRAYDVDAFGGGDEVASAFADKSMVIDEQDLDRRSTPAMSCS